MKPLLSFIILQLLLLILMPARGAGQQVDSLIERSLRAFDLPSFEWGDQRDPMRPRLGAYFQRLSDEDAAKIPGYRPGMRIHRIWHLMPHWSGDEAGLYPGDLVTAIDGRPIMDTAFSADDLINKMVRRMTPGDTLHLSILRDGAVREIPIRLLAAAHVPMSPPPAPPQLGPVRSDTWLSQSLRDLKLHDRARTIQKQLRVIADQDFCTVPFAGRPNPWRLGAVTYLHNNPTRVGAYSRWMSNDLWNETHNGTRLSGAIVAAARGLDIEMEGTGGVDVRPSGESELTIHMRNLQRMLDKAYMPVRGDLDSMTRDLLALLDIGQDWETGLDTIADPVARRARRLQVEGKLASLFGRADKVDLKSLAFVAWRLTALADSAWITGEIARLSSGSAGGGTRPPGVEGDLLHAWNTELGWCVIGGAGRNRYTGDIRFILDAGGDDIYELSPVPVGTFRFIGDAAGNDIHASAGAGQGAGIGCVDVLADLGGDDIYRSVRFSQGAGLLGVGVLADHAGDDIYTSRWCSQGAAFLGIGILYDGAGSDSYSAEVYSQAFGYIRGYGAIIERGGNDSYRAGWKHPDSRIPGRAHLAMSQGFGYGMRPWITGVGADGGIGILTDRGGHDLYASDFFSQGGSYWYALGILHDAGGCDRYTAGQYSQGSGIHLSFGALLDDSGDDMYDAYAGLEQGNAHDWSAGCLEDWSGNDTYRGSSSSQGSALNVSMAWLVDGGGNDQYYINNADTLHSQGGGNFNIVREEGGIGMLVDLGAGNDYYVEPRIVAGKPLVKGYGVVYDDGGK